MLNAYIRRESVRQEVSVDRNGYSQPVAANHGRILLSRAPLVCIAAFGLTSSHELDEPDEEISLALQGVRHSYAPASEDLLNKSRRQKLNFNRM